MAVRVDGCRIVTGYSGAIKTLLANSGCKPGHQDVNTVNIANIDQPTCYLVPCCCYSYKCEKYLRSKCSPVKV